MRKLFFFWYWSYPEKISKYFLPAQPTFIIIYQFSYTIDIASYLQHFSRLEIASRFETSKRILNMIGLSERCGGHQRKNCFIWKKIHFVTLTKQPKTGRPVSSGLRSYNIGQVRVHPVHWNLVECNEIDTERLFEGFTFISNSYTHMKIIIWKRDSCIFGCIYLSR